MRLGAHFVASIILAAVLYPFFGVYSLLVIVTGFLIDSDHYLYYVLSGKGWNPIKANRFFIDVKSTGVMCIFHTVEFFVAVAVYSLFSYLGVLLLLGWVLHYVMDLYSDHKLDRMDSKEKSFIMWVLRR